MAPHIDDHPSQDLEQQGNHCPFCGAEVEYLGDGPESVVYKCGTGNHDDWMRTDICYEAEIEELKQRCQSLAAHSVLDESELAQLRQAVGEAKKSIIDAKEDMVCFCKDMCEKPDHCNICETEMTVRNLDEWLTTYGGKP